MGKTMKLILAGIFGATLVGAPQIAFAQNDPSSQIIRSLEYQDADVREALRALFRQVGVSYTIDPQVQGIITVSLRDQTFEVCLQQILRQVNATYRVEAGVYNIIPRVDEGPIGGGTTETPITNNADGKEIRRIYLRSADPLLIMTLVFSQRGSTSTQLPPEISTLLNGGSQGGIGGGGGGFGGGGQGGLGGGQGGLGGGGFGGGGFGGGGGGLGGGGFGGGGFGGGGRGGF